MGSRWRLVVASSVLSLMVLPHAALSQCSGTGPMIRFEDLFAYETAYSNHVSTGGSLLTLVGSVRQFCNVLGDQNAQDPILEYTLHIPGLYSMGTTTTDLGGTTRYSTTYASGPFTIYQGSPRNAPAPGSMPPNPPNGLVPSTFQDGIPLITGNVVSMLIEEEVSAGNYAVIMRADLALEGGAFACRFVESPTVRLQGIGFGTEGSLLSGYRARMLNATLARVPANPVVSVNPNCAPQGALFSEPGRGFTPNSTAELHFVRPDQTEYPPPYVTRATDGCGEYQHLFDSSSLPHGIYSYYAIDASTGARSPTVSFEVVPVPIVASQLRVTNPGTSKSLELAWNASPSTSGYIIRQSKNGGFSDVIQVQAGTSYVATGLDRGANYSYTVSAYHGCIESAAIGPVVGRPDFYPVLLVHGLCSSRDAFTDCGLDFPCTPATGARKLGDALHELDPDLRLYAFTYSDLASLTEASDAVERNLEHVLDLTGEPRVTLIGHSQGGLISRYLAHSLNQNAKIDAIVMIGTPNHGTDLARLALLPAPPRWLPRSLPCLIASEARYDLKPGSEFLNQLNFGTAGTQRALVLCPDPPTALEAPDPEPAPETWLIHGTAGWCKFPTGKGALNVAGLCEPHDGAVETGDGTDGDLARLDLEHQTLDNHLDPQGIHPRASHDQKAAGDCFLPELEHPSIIIAVYNILTTRSFTGDSPPGARSREPAPTIATPEPARLARHLDGLLGVGVVHSDSVGVETTSQVTILQSADAGGLSFTLRTPSGATISPHDTSATVHFEADSALALQAFTVLAPEPGLWRVESGVLPGGTEQEYSLDVYVVSDVALQLEERSPTVAGPRIMRARMSVAGTPLSGALVTGSLVASDLGSTPLAFLDDGAHDDEMAGDGIFGASLVAANAEGAYAVTVQGVAVVAGAELRREEVASLAIERFADLAIVPAGITVERWSPGAGTDSLRVRVVVENLGDHDAPNTRISFVDAAPFAQQILSVAAGGSAEISQLWIPSQEDSVTLLVHVDRSSPFLQIRYDNDSARVVIHPSTVSVPVADGSSRLALAPAFPNPSRGAVTIRFSLSRPGPVTLGLYDLSGRRIQTLVDAMLRPGVHSRTWNRSDREGRRVPAGIYFYELFADGQRIARRVAILR